MYKKQKLNPEFLFYKKRYSQFKKIKPEIHIKKTIIALCPIKKKNRQRYRKTHNNQMNENNRK